MPPGFHAEPRMSPRHDRCRTGWAESRQTGGEGDPGPELSARATSPPARVESATARRRSGPPGDHKPPGGHDPSRGRQARAAPPETTTAHDSSEVPRT